MSVLLYLNAWLKHFKQRLSGQPQSEHSAVLAKLPADLPHIGDNTMTSTPTPATDPAENLAKKTAPSIAQQHAATTGAPISMNDQTIDTAVTPVPVPVQDDQAAQVTTSTAAVKAEQDNPVRSVSVQVIPSAENSTAAPAHTETASPPLPVAKKDDAKTAVETSTVVKAKVKSQAKSSPPAKAEPEAKPQAKHEPTADPVLKTEAAPEEETQAPALTACEPDQHWQACYEAVTGLAHRDANPPLPCQDSAVALNSSRPIVIVADGAGSSAVSELGSQAVTTGLARLLNTLERQVAQLLDQPQNSSSEEVRSFALLLDQPQDSAVALNSSRPIVIVADGAGSSAVSELGSQAVTTGLARLLNTLERQVAQLLDQPQNSSSEEVRSFALLLVKHAKGILDDLAVQHRRPQKDFRCTLLLAIQGKAQLLWLKIGDGALVIETLQQDAGKLLPTLTTLGRVGKGEFANATTFIDDHLQPTDVQTGSCSSAHITGFTAMSDGAADRLVANDGSHVSPQISDWLNKLRHGKLKRRELTRLFSSEHFTHGTTGDDASVALCASGLKTDAATTAGKP